MVTGSINIESGNASNIPKLRFFKGKRKGFSNRIKSNIDFNAYFSNKLVSEYGDAIPKQAREVTPRTVERLKENDLFLPVIIKRHDTCKVHPDDMLERAINEGLNQINRPTFSLFLSSLAAGLILGFSAMAVAVVTELMGSSSSLYLEKIAVALVYPTGFILCIMSGNQLFTEHTATAVYPYLDRLCKFKKLLKLWGVVLFGNLFGALISAVLIVYSNDVVGATEGYIAVAEHLTSFSTVPLFVSAVLAGLLMAQGAWMLLASSSQVGQVLCIFLATFMIGIGGFHHSIAGSAELFAAILLSSEFGWRDAGSFIPITVLGNLVGGSILVAILNYCHIRETQKKKTN
jgi:formate/nitrite transporter FocA (FNT family)